MRIRKLPWITVLSVAGTLFTNFPVASADSAAALGPYVSGMRKFPYPYQSMLAVSSDADHETLRKFNLEHQFLNTTEQTPLGKGLGLDISDSMFMYNGSNLNSSTDINQTALSQELTWFKGTSNTSYAMPILSYYIQHGWIDTLHSFGDFSMQNESQTRFSKSLATQAIRSLEQNGASISVWTDHGNKSNVDDFGNYGKTPFYTYQQGANPWSRYYFTNQLIPYGVKFVWADGNSNVFGKPSLIYPITLPDGRKVWGFDRYTDTYSGKTVHWVWTIDDFPQEVNPNHLNEIIQNHEYSIVATHFSADNNLIPFDPATIDGFRLLQREYLSGKILVARTSRLLNYNVLQQYLKYSVLRVPGKTIINITGVDDPVSGHWMPNLADLYGITFYTWNPMQTEIELAGKPVPSSLLQDNPSDGTSPSIGFKWYPSDTKDYSIASYPSQKRITFNGKTVALPYGLVSNGTTYMPIWYIIQALNSMGIQNTWDGKDWSLTTSSQVDLSNLTPGTGSSSVRINGTTVQEITSLTTTDPSSGKPTTYMPIWYMMQVLKRLGLVSNWDGLTWQTTSQTSL